jgi:hypothetical protein
MDLALWSQSRKAVGGTRPGWARVKAGEAIPLAEPELSPSDDGRFLMQMKPKGAQFRPTSSTKAQPVGAMLRTHHSRTRTGNPARIRYGVLGSPAIWPELGMVSPDPGSRYGVPGSCPRIQIPPGRRRRTAAGHVFRTTLRLFSYSGGKRRSACCRRCCYSNECRRRG